MDEEQQWTLSFLPGCLQLHKMLAELKNEQTQDFLHESRRGSWETARAQPDVETSHQEGRSIILQDQVQAQEDHKGQAAQRKNKDKDYLQGEHASTFEPFPEQWTLKANVAFAI